MRCIFGQHANLYSMNKWYRLCTAFAVPKITAFGLAVIFGPKVLGEAYDVLFMAPWQWMLDIVSLDFLQYSFLDAVCFFMPAIDFGWQYLLVDILAWWLGYSISKK